MTQHNRRTFDEWLESRYTAGKANIRLRVSPPLSNFLSQVVAGDTNPTFRPSIDPIKLMVMSTRSDLLV